MKKIIITLAIIIAAINVFGQNYQVFVDGKEIVDTQKVSMKSYITNFLNNSTDSSYMVIKDKDTDVYVVVSNGDFFCVVVSSTRTENNYNECFYKKKDYLTEVSDFVSWTTNVLATE